MKTNTNYVINGKVHQSKHTFIITFSPDQLLQHKRAWIFSLSSDCFYGRQQFTVVNYVCHIFFSKFDACCMWVCVVRVLAFVLASTIHHPPTLSFYSQLLVLPLRIISVSFSSTLSFLIKPVCNSSYTKFPENASLLKGLWQGLKHEIHSDDLTCFKQIPKLFSLLWKRYKAE